MVAGYWRTPITVITEDKDALAPSGGSEFGGIKHHWTKGGIAGRKLADRRCQLWERVGVCEPLHVFHYECSWLCLADQSKKVPQKGATNIILAPTTDRTEPLARRAAEYEVHRAASMPD
jgi:hypothetical protein